MTQDVAASHALQSTRTIERAPAATPQPQRAPHQNSCTIHVSQVPGSSAMARLLNLKLCTRFGCATFTDSMASNCVRISVSEASSGAGCRMILTATGAPSHKPR